MTARPVPTPRIRLITAPPTVKAAQTVHDRAPAQIPDLIGPGRGRDYRARAEVRIKHANGARIRRQVVAAGRQGRICSSDRFDRAATCGPEYSRSSEAPASRSQSEW